ncbi:unnamed protein product (macronuclear) [Paramecium tetraurelia]|uniref:Shugoshin C-terminal domain-containing protein n=1 Tax=Paramecium tetraurelia TaxID=5888 RepID=A0E029_PARTE|nr:uncharacterized protein GSPATT00021814001 [Paramecium tetraurelia]CAK88646.1 unnamed protein product [Paramecium tetraurelia]|eukprot:XP_001456043.1 hypothetical protein (macronuclear) [Paramecium tetraurelia strain d4-2]
MGNGCSGQREMTERSYSLRQPSITLTRLTEQEKLITLVPASQLTQIDLPNALLPSPSRQSISFEPLSTSKVRVPSEESQFQNQFVQTKEVKLIKKKHDQPSRPQIQVPKKEHKKKEVCEITPKYHSSSPKKKNKQKSTSPLGNQQYQNYDNNKTNKSNRKKSSTSQQKIKQINEIEIISRRKYSDLPPRTEKTQVKRKISNSIDDHNFIIGTDCVSKVKSFTPSPILKRRDSDCETNSFQKKMVRFKDVNYRRPGFVN